MQAVHRELVNIARGVDGGKILDHYTTNGRAEVVFAGPNGTSRKFFLSLRGGDLRSAVNVRRQMERWVEDNPDPTTKPAVKLATPEKIKELVVAQPAPNPRPTLTVPKVPAKEIPADLTLNEMFRLGTWLAGSCLTDYCDIDACAAAASIYLDRAVQPDSVAQALKMAAVSEPAQWSAPLDPVTVLADELARIMTDLGVEPSEQFLRLAKQLHKD